MNTKRYLFVLFLGPWLLLAACVGGWFLTGPSVERRAAGLRAQQRQQWADHRQPMVDSLQRANPEFDLMWRLFAVLAACDRALAVPDTREAELAFIDGVLHDTLDTLEEKGQNHFLLGYAQADPWVRPEAGSLFVDGEVALMIAARRVVADSPELRAPGRHWVQRVELDLTLAGAGWPESYPDEAWAFCIVNALLALRMHDVVEGTDHSATIHRWASRLAQQGIDPRTGLLGSDWRADGTPRQGTEGSSLWWVTAGLRVLDPSLAEAQYVGARGALVDGLPGLAWSREWPHAASGGDIDSGPLVPFFEASPAASGFALVAAAAHDDRPTSGRLRRALRAADLLLVVDPRLADMDEAPMGDAIVALGLGFGPLWQEVGPPVTP